MESVNKLVYMKKQKEKMKEWKYIGSIPVFKHQSLSLLMVVCVVE